MLFTVTLKWFPREKLVYIRNVSRALPFGEKQEKTKYLEGLNQSMTKLTSHSLALLFPCESEVLQGLTTTTTTR